VHFHFPAVEKRADNFPLPNFRAVADHYEPFSSTAKSLKNIDTQKKLKKIERSLHRVIKAEKTDP